MECQVILTLACNKQHNMKFFTLLIAATFSLGAISQITISQSDFPSPNDTAMVSMSSDVMLDYTTTGASSIWDFSAITISDQEIDTFFSVADAGALIQVVFNNSWLNPNHVSDYYKPYGGGALAQLGTFGIGIESPMQYTKVSADSVYNTGISFIIQGQSIPAKSDTIDTQYMLPMSYGDSWSGSSYTNLDMNPAFDAIYRRYQTRNSVVDGWGTVITPFGSFDAIRVKSFVSGIDSIYIGTFSTWTQLPTPDQIEYQWFATGQKVPVFEIITTDLGGNETVTSVRFKDKLRYFASVEENNFNGEIYPNPATDQVTLNFTTIPQKIEILDMAGKVVYSDVPESTINVVNTSNWNTGFYLIKVLDNSQVSTSKLVIE